MTSHLVKHTDEDNIVQTLENILYPHIILRSVLNITC